MTVTDRRPAIDAAGRLAWSAAVAEPIDPIDLFATARALGIEAALWLQPAADRSIVGIGRAWAFEGSGPDRFTAAATAWRGLLADAIGSDEDVPETGPTLLGGLGFGGRLPAAGDPWAPFGPSSLVLPRFALAQAGARAGLTIAIGPDESAGLGRDGLERHWRELLRPHRHDATGSGSAAVDRRTPRSRGLGSDRGSLRRGRRSWPDRQGRAGATRRLPRDDRSRHRGGAPAPGPDGSREHHLRLHP